MNYDKIRPYIEKGLIREQVHPEDSNVRIFNYTQKCQFEKEWDEVTLTCRGFIMNIETGEILARPFKKFFNVSEHKEVYNLKIPDEEPYIYEKYDGSLGILYWLNNKPHIATRGSFTSDQAIWATKWFRECVDTSTLNRDWTDLFEIIYPENKIVVNYDFSGLVFLASLHRETGEDTNFQCPPQLKNGGQQMMRAKRIPYTNLSLLHKLDKGNAEGFVVHYPIARLRLKVKFEEYVRLHKIVTGLSVIGVWEYLQANGVDAPIRGIAENAPDEFYKWLEKTADEIREAYFDIREVSCKQFGIITSRIEEFHGADAERKIWAEEIKKMKYPAIGFYLLDNKDYKPLIWKMIRPKGNVTFKIDD